MTIKTREGENNTSLTIRDDGEKVLLEYRQELDTEVLISTKDKSFKVTLAMLYDFVGRALRKYSGESEHLERREEIIAIGRAVLETRRKLDQD